MEVVCKPKVVVGFCFVVVIVSLSLVWVRGHLLSQLSRKPFRKSVPRHKFKDSVDLS